MMDRTGITVPFGLSGETLTLTNNPAGRLPGDLTVKQLDEQHLALSGTANGKNLEVTLHKLKREDFLLINRGYHWINEYPFNR
jgi:hypothetical protein